MSCVLVVFVCFVLFYWEVGFFLLFFQNVYHMLNYYLAFFQHVLIINYVKDLIVWNQYVNNCF